MVSMIDTIGNKLMMSSAMPDNVKSVEFLMEPLNTSTWMWAFRGLFAIAMIGFIISFIYYYKKKGDK